MGDSWTVNSKSNNLEADGLEQQKTTPGATVVSQVQETETKIQTGSVKLDNIRQDKIERLEKSYLVWQVESGVGLNNVKPWNAPALCQTIQAGDGGAIVWGFFWAWIKCHSLPKYCCWPFMTTVCPSSNGFFEHHDNGFTVLKWPLSSSVLNPIEHLWDAVIRHLFHGGAVHKSVATMWCYCVSNDHNLWGIWQWPCWIHAIKI